MSKQNHTRYRTMLKYLGINNSHVSKITGLSYSHVRDSLVPQNFSKWARFTLWVFDEMKKKRLVDVDVTVSDDLKGGKLHIIHEAESNVTPEQIELTKGLMAKYITNKTKDK